MTQFTCTEVRDAAAEFALDILEPPERSAIAAHLLRCPACRAEVDSMCAVGTELLQLVPGTEPPLGFDHRVMARVGEHRHSWAGRARRHPRIVGAVAAAAALIFGAVGWMAGRTTTTHAARVMLTAEIHQGARTVGRVEAYPGHPAWVNMSIHGSSWAGWVTCQIVEKDGKTVNLGSFNLVHGGGSWGAPDTAWANGLSAVRLVNANGDVLATAVLR
jgi:anti-sigma factor RsiW